MNYVEIYITLSSVLVAVILGLRQFRRQQLVQYVQQYYGHTAQLLYQQQPQDELHRVLVDAIQHGELAHCDDQHLGQLVWQLRCLSCLPIMVLVIGFAVAATLQA
ncbi:hypothetical protein [Shewanella sp.]|uniref:hypothetical protein n=1 Tax=Shewanella sp. TaxID=50422 RepID=UPI003A976230